MKNEVKDEKNYYESSQGFLNKGEEDEMEVVGYEGCRVYRLLTYLVMVLTMGLLRLVFHWWPHLGLYSTHRQTSLATATKLLVTDTYEKRFKQIFVKDVKIIFPTENRVAHIYNDSKEISLNLKEKKLDTVEINLADGSTKDVEEIRAVWIKKLCYVWIEESNCFVKLVGLDNGKLKSQFHNFGGFSNVEQKRRQIPYGLNEINVPIQGIPTLIALEMLNPFYIFQVFALAVWLSDEYYYYSVAIIVMSLFGITSSVIQTHNNQKKLQATVHSTDIVTVKRGRNDYEEIPTTLLVPGDIIAIPPHGCVVHCDAILLNGNCIVNESMLTGESVPVTKTPLPNVDGIYSGQEDSNHTLFCGTTVIQTRYYGFERVEAVVTRTGFLTAKGSLVRSILYPPPADFKFDQDSYKFIWVLATIGTIGFIYTITTKTLRGIEMFDVFVKAFDLFTIVIPPALPAAMTVGKIYALGRLKKEKITCINSRVINVSGSLNCCCFDKTGTLTEDGLDMWGVISVEEGRFLQPSFRPDTLPMDHLVYGMASCHTLTLIEGNISGDPLEVKMFNSTGWELIEPELADNTKYDLLIPTIVKPPDDDSTEIGILHQFHFSSKLQRMSVITRRSDSQDLVAYCKGSPEMILSLSNAQSVPADALKTLKEYTKQGYRVLALAWKPLTHVAYHKLEKIPREEVEKDLNLVGLIVLENRLKKESIPTIKELKNAAIKIVMITGDNMQTALSVAKECGIIEPTDTTVEIHAVDDTSDVPELEYHIIRNGEHIGPTDSYRYTNGSLEDGVKSKKVKIATSGKTWALIRDKIPELLPRLLIQGAVFARMTSEQKMQLIVELQKIGYFVAMCGDGANDCGALKAAHVGISLSEAEASVASPFTCADANISCTTKVIREGRAALVTSFGVFKFMLLYSLTEFFSTLFLYRIDSNLSDFQFLFIDIFLVVNFALFFGQNKAYKGPIVRETPLSSILNIIPIISLTLQFFLLAIFQAASFYLVRSFPWFEPFHLSGHKKYKSYENFAVYSVSQFQYITMAVVFSQGPPYREPIYKNKIFFISIIVLFISCIYITLNPAQWMITILQLKYPPSIDFPLIIVLFGLVNFVLAIFLEDFLVNYILFKKMKCGTSNSSSLYLGLEKDFENAEWPPQGKRFSVIEKSNSVEFTDANNVLITKL